MTQSRRTQKFQWLKVDTKVDIVTPFGFCFTKFKGCTKTDMKISYSLRVLFHKGVSLNGAQNRQPKAEFMMHLSVQLPQGSDPSSLPNDGIENR